MLNFAPDCAITLSIPNASVVARNFTFPNRRKSYRSHGAYSHGRHLSSNMSSIMVGLNLRILTRISCARIACKKQIRPAPSCSIAMINGSKATTPGEMKKPARQRQGRISLCDYEMRLFDTPPTPPEKPAATCRTCANRQRWRCGGSIIQYCGVRPSNRTLNRLLKIKVTNPACAVYKSIDDSE